MRGKLKKYEVLVRTGNNLEKLRAQNALNTHHYFVMVL
jgi:hypothetical protein